MAEERWQHLSCTGKPGQHSQESSAQEKQPRAGNDQPGAGLDQFPVALKAAHLAELGPLRAPHKHARSWCCPGNPGRDKPSESQRQKGSSQEQLSSGIKESLFLMSQKSASPVGWTLITDSIVEQDLVVCVNRMVDSRCDNIQFRSCLPSFRWCSSLK